MERLYRLVDLVATGTLSVILQGEPASAKRGDGQAHSSALGARRQSLSEINAGLRRIDGGSELFGHERGAFTGAAQAKAGLLESRFGWHVLLDEVASSPCPCQAKLLRAVVTRRACASAASNRGPSTCGHRRTNGDFNDLIQRGAFRSDSISAEWHLPDHSAGSVNGKTRSCRWRGSSWPIRAPGSLQAVIVLHAFQRTSLATDSCAARSRLVHQLPFAGSLRRGAVGVEGDGAARAERCRLEPLWSGSHRSAPMASDEFGASRDATRSRSSSRSCGATETKALAAPLALLGSRRTAVHRLDAVRSARHPRPASVRTSMTTEAAIGASSRFEIAMGGALCCAESCNPALESATNCRANDDLVFRSRSGEWSGRCHSSGNRGPNEMPALNQVVEITLVAAMNRTSMAAFEAADAQDLRVPTARSSLACMGKESSATSSSSTVPPEAASSSPALACARR